MATEKSISSGAISFANFITASNASVISSTFADATNPTTESFGQEPMYPRTNLLSSQRSKKWRSPASISRGVHAVAFDLGSGKSPQVFALIGSNLGYTSPSSSSAMGIDINNTLAPNSSVVAGTKIVLQGSNSGNFSSVAEFTYDLYDADTVNEVQRFYIDKDDSGVSISGGYRYWRIILPSYSTTENYAEIGTVWLGLMTEISPEIGGLNIAQSDNSKVAYSQGRASYVDRVTATRNIKFSINHVEDEAEGIPLQRLAATAGSASAVLLDISAWTDDSVSSPTRRSSDVYYGKLSSRGFSWKGKFQRRRSVNFSFVETR